MDALLQQFEQRVDLDAKRAAKLLGFAYSTYNQYQTGLRPLPRYGRNQIKALLRLSDPQLAEQIREVVYGD